MENAFGPTSSVNTFFVSDEFKAVRRSKYCNVDVGKKRLENTNMHAYTRIFVHSRPDVRNHAVTTAGMVVGTRGLTYECKLLFLRL